MLLASPSAQVSAEESETLRELGKEYDGDMPEGYEPWSASTKITDRERFVDIIAINDETPISN